MSGEEGGIVGAAVRRLVEQHADDRGPLMPVLHDLQQEFGHVPPEAVPLLARELNLSRAEVYGVVTFYRDFRDAPAQARVRVCRGEACQSVGAEDLVRQATAHLGRVQGSVEVDHVFCLGNCSLGPSVEVNGAIYGRVNGGQLDALISRVAK